MGEKPKKRRGRGEGGIYFRRDRNCYAAMVSRGMDPVTGKRKRVTVFGKTKAEVIEKMLKVQAEASQGLLPNTKGKSVEQFLNEWLEVSVRPNLRPNTYSAYEVAIRCHLVPRLGKIPLEKLTAIQVQATYVDMEKKKASPRTRQHTHAVLRRALQQAVKWGLIPRNVADSVDRPKATRKRFPVLNQDEARRFLDAAREDRLYALYVLAITTGLRQGELLGLRWEDIDLKNGKLTISRTMLETGGRLFPGEPKTKAGARLIVLPQVARVALREHRERMLAEGRTAGYVFCDTKGGPIRKGNLLRRSFKPILERAKLQDMRFHDLRHTAATLLLGMNVNPKIVQEILGHSNISITLDTYSHVTPTMQKEAAEQMDRLMGGSDPC